MSYSKARAGPGSPGAAGLRMLPGGPDCVEPVRPVLGQEHTHCETSRVFSPPPQHISRTQAGVSPDGMILFSWKRNRWSYRAGLLSSAPAYSTLESRLYFPKRKVLVSKHQPQTIISYQSQVNLGQSGCTAAGPFQLKNDTL